MTVNLSEPSQAAENARGGFEERRLQRRPVAATTGFLWEIKALSDLRTLTVGDNKFTFLIPLAFNGLSLLSAEAFVTTFSSSGNPQIQLRNVTQAVDMLSTKITIDQAEYHSYTAATPSVVNVANAVVATGDRISIDIDVSGTGAKGLGIIVEFG